MSIEVRGQLIKVPLYQCSVEVHRHSVGIFSETNAFIPFFNGFQEKEYIHDIPGWKVMKEPKPNESRIIYLPARKSQFIYDENQRTMVIQAPEEDVSDGQALAYISYWMSEGQRQQERSFTMHAAALSVNRRGVLLIGDRGAGKTSLILGLAQKYPTKLIANDLTILSHNPEQKQILLEEGSKRIRLRLRSVLSRFPNLLPQFPDTEGSAWTTKVLVNPKQLEINLEDQVAILSRAFIIHLSNIEDEDIIVKRSEGIVPYFELYENLSRIIRGSGVSIFGNKENILGYIPSLETEQTHDNKISLLNYLIKDQGIWSIAGGNLDKMCETIYNLSI